MTNKLTQIEFSSRLPIRMPVSSSEVYGWPLNTEIESWTERVRNLNESQCIMLASQTAPIANEIATHRQWLVDNNGACPGLLEGMQHQESYERNLYVGRSLELFLNLANIYSQQPEIQDSHLILGQTAAAIEKIREADVQLAVDTKQLDRQHLEIDEQSIGLWQNQQKLTRGLELLLSLEPNTRPIWTVVETPVLQTDFDPAAEYAMAISQRGDLKMLYSLSNDCSSLTAEQMKSLVAANSPLTGGGLPRPIAALWWQRKLKDKVQQRVDQISEIELTRRREQLVGLAESKKKLVKREIIDVIESIRGNQLLLQAKQQRLQSLSDSIAAAELAKDDVPLDPVSHLQNRLSLTKLQAEVTNQEFQLALDVVRLKRIRGDFSVYGNSNGPNVSQGSLVGTPVVSRSDVWWRPAVQAQSVLQGPLAVGPTIEIRSPNKGIDPIRFAPRIK